MAKYDNNHFANASKKAASTATNNGVPSLLILLLSPKQSKTTVRGKSAFKEDSKRLNLGLDDIPRSPSFRATS